MTAAPKHIRALSDQKLFEIQWNNETVHRIPFKVLRGLCPCAGCVNEFTGERMIDVNTIAEEIQPTSLDFAGNYALKIAWTDQHDTGLYTWERLQAIGDTIVSGIENTQAGHTPD